MSKMIFLISFFLGLMGTQAQAKLCNGDPLALAYFFEDQRHGAEMMAAELRKSGEKVTLVEASSYYGKFYSCEQTPFGRIIYYCPGCSG